METRLDRLEEWLKMENEDGKTDNSLLETKL